MNEYILFDIDKNKIVSVNENDVFDKLYFQKCRVPTSSELKKEKRDETVNDIKKSISKIEYKFPLYDPFTSNIYLVDKKYVYDRVINQHYRFPEQKILDELRDELENSDTDDIDQLEIRKQRKIGLMLKFMENFDIDTLNDTYIKIFYKLSDDVANELSIYKYSDNVGKELTICKNPSFHPNFYHIKPYLSRNEIINYALNFNIIDENCDDLNHKDIMKLCKKVNMLQINSSILLEHQNYIMNNNLGLVQYYTIQGSFFMNQYLRNMTQYTAKNVYLESLIKPMWQLVKNAPAFDKSYIVYRFIGNDDYLKGLNIGNIFTEKGFMSTTRDPFYRADLYKFGFILLKIKIPAHIKGVALCLETISHFPDEQEIIFPPNTQFKLTKRDADCSYYHTNTKFTSDVKTRYEFEWVENESIVFPRKEIIQTKEPLNFLKIKKSKGATLDERINFFIQKYTNIFHQFSLKFDSHEYTIMTEWYDGSSVYKDHYGITENNGFAMYTLYKGYMLFFIEITNGPNEPIMHVNKYIRYTSIDTNNLIGDENLIKFYSSVAYYFDVPSIVLYGNYLNCNTQIIRYGNSVQQRSFSIKNKDNISSQEKIKKDQPKFMGSYCVDFYDYLANNKKKCDSARLLQVELMPEFSYYDLDLLKEISPTKILNKTQSDELYQIYDKIFKKTGKNDTISEFYIWIVQNKCYLIDDFVLKINKIPEIKKNPFEYDWYILDPYAYLYERKYIQQYPDHMKFQTRHVKSNVLMDK